MSKILVLYKSKYGATEQYAHLLAQTQQWDICPLADSGAKNLSEYDGILFAGGIYASGIAGIRELEKRFEELKNQKIAVFCVGASPMDEKNLLEIKQRNLRGALSGIPLFYGRGAWDESKMSFKDRLLVGMLQKAVSGKNPAVLESWMTALLEASGQKCSWVDQKYLEPVIAYFLK